MANLRHLLNQKNSGTYFRPFNQILGPLASILLNELLYWHDKFEEANRLTSDKKNGDGWFYLVTEKIIQRLGLGKHQVRSSIELLTNERGIFETAFFGIPGKRYFRLNEKALNKLMEEAQVTPNIDEMDIENMSNDDPFESEPSPNKNSKSKSSSPKTGTLGVEKPDSWPSENRKAIYKEYKGDINTGNIHTAKPAPPSNIKILNPAATASAVCVCDDFLPDDFVPSNQDRVSCNITSSDGRCQSDDSSAKKPKPEEKQSYGADGLVKLTQKQYEDLILHMSAKERDTTIEDLNNYIASVGKKYKSHYHTILTWISKNKQSGKLSSKNQITEPTRADVIKYSKDWHMPRGVQVDLTDHKIRIEGGGAHVWCEEISYSEKGFFEKLENALRKRQFTKRLQA
jgi:hypothetical protein